MNEGRVEHCPQVGGTAFVKVMSLKKKQNTLWHMGGKDFRNGLIMWRKSAV